MKTYTLHAELDNSIYTEPLYARCDLTAICLAAPIIAKRSVHDKRFSEGKITVKDTEGKDVYVIPKTGEAYFVDQTKREED